MPKFKISLAEFEYRCKLQIFEDVLVEGLGYVVWIYITDTRMLTAHCSGTRAWELPYLRLRNLKIDRFFLTHTTAVVLPAYLDPDFDRRREESEDKLLRLYKKHYTDDSGKLDAEKYREIERNVKEDTLFLESDNSLVPAAIRYSKEMIEYFDYHKGVNRRRRAMSSSANSRLSNLEPIEKHIGNANGQFSDIQTGVGISLTLASMLVGIKESTYDYKYLRSLYNNNQFFGIKNGERIVMDKSYLSTKRMRATRGVENINFRNTMKPRIRVHCFGKIVSLASIVNSYAQYRNEPNLTNLFDLGINAASWRYWQIGAAYTAGQLYIDLSKEQMRQMDEAKKEADPKEKFWLDCWSILPYSPYGFY